MILVHILFGCPGQIEILFLLTDYSPHIQDCLNSHPVREIWTTMTKMIYKKDTNLWISTCSGLNTQGVIRHETFVTFIRVRPATNVLSFHWLRLSTGWTTTAPNRESIWTNATSPWALETSFLSNHQEPLWHIIYFFVFFVSNNLIIIGGQFVYPQPTFDIPCKLLRPNGWDRREQ